MYGFEEWADAFDRMKDDNLRAYRQSAQGWVTETYLKDGEGVKFYAAAVTAGVGDALFDFVQSMGGGLVDTLRLGEGVKEGTVGGVLQDGVRAIGVVGVGMRVARLAGFMTVGGGRMSCAITGATKAMRFSGVRIFAGLGEVGRAFGQESYIVSPGFPGVQPNAIQKLLNTMIKLGARVRSIRGGLNLATIANMARAGEGPVLFGVRWTNGSKHIMMAYRTITGGVRYADQSVNFKTLSSIAKDLAAVEEAHVVLDGWVLHASAGAVGTMLLRPAARTALEDIIGIPYYIVPAETVGQIDARIKDETRTRGPTAPPAKKWKLRTTAGLKQPRVTVYDADGPEPPSVPSNPNGPFQYPAQPGETLADIATRYYGDAAAASAIAAANADQFGITGRSPTQPLARRIYLNMPND